MQSKDTILKYNCCCFFKSYTYLFQQKDVMYRGQNSHFSLCYKHLNKSRKEAPVVVPMMESRKVQNSTILPNRLQISGCKILFQRFNSDSSLLGYDALPTWVKAPLV